MFGSVCGAVYADFSEKKRAEKKAELKHRNPKTTSAVHDFSSQQVVIFLSLSLSKRSPEASQNQSVSLLIPSIRVFTVKNDINPGEI